MASSRNIQNNFTSGVLSPLTRGRADIQQYFNGLAQCDDFVLLPQGGVKARGGLAYTERTLGSLTFDTTTPTTPNGGTGANAVDGDLSTYLTTTTPIGVTDNYVIAAVDLGADTDVALFNIRKISISTAVATTEIWIQHKPDGGAWTDLLNLPLVSNVERDYRVSIDVPTREFRVIRKGTTDLTTSVASIAELGAVTESSVSNVKMQEFSYDSDTHYLMVFTDKNCRVFRKGVTPHVIDLWTDYASADVAEIRTVQAEAVMLAFQEDHAPIRITNFNSDTIWRVDEAPFTVIPQYDFNDSDSPTPVADIQVLTFAGFVIGDTFQLDVEGVLSKNITWAGDLTADAQSSTAFNIRKNLQDMPNFGETGISVARTALGEYTVTINGESADDYELISGFATEGTAAKGITVVKTQNGSPRSEDVWSATRGYPRSACFYDGRLVLGGTTQKPQSVFLSKAGSFYDFDIGEGDPDEAIFITITSRKFNRIFDVYPGRDLQIFTSDQEFVIDTKPITPEDVVVKPQTSHGASNLEVKEIDGATFFIDRFGKKLFNYLYSFNEDAYNTQSPSVLSPESISSPVDIDILRGTASSDANWIFIVNSNGGVSVLNTLREQDINGFTHFTKTGESATFTNVVVVDDQVYFISNQTVNGVNGNYLLRWDDEYLTDNSIKIAHGGGATLSAATHLAGQTVTVFGDGNYIGELTVDANGDITLPLYNQDYTTYEVGYLFNPYMKFLPVATSVGSGNNFFRIKKVVKSNIRVHQNTLLQLDDNIIEPRTFNDTALSGLDAYTGILEDSFDNIGWGRDDSPEITLPQGGRGIVLAVDMEVESS